MPVLYRQTILLCQGVRFVARADTTTRMKRSHPRGLLYTLSVKDVKDQFEITADPANASAARARLRAAATEAGFAGTALDDFEVAMGEALSNAILHGSPTSTSLISVCISFILRTREFSVEVTDRGEGFDPQSVKRKAGSDDVNGRGLKMMAILVDKAILFHDGVGMTVRLVKRVPERI